MVSPPCSKRIAGTGGGNIRNRRDGITVNDHLYATLTTTNSTNVLTDLLALIVGVIFATGTLAAVLSIPTDLVGFTFGAL